MLGGAGGHLAGGGSTIMQKQQSGRVAMDWGAISGGDGVGIGCEDDCNPNRRVNVNFVEKA